MSTLVITGANRGIGLALCQSFIGKGNRVIALCRQSSKELDDSGAQVIDGIDFLNKDVSHLCAQKLAGVDIDILINNAGILEADRLGNIDPESVMRQLHVNAVAPIGLTQLLVPQLSPQAKVVFITSRMGSMEDNQSGAYYGYRMSKASLNAAGVSLANDLRPQGISVGIFHPGFVSTQMVGANGDISPAVAASRLIERIDELDITNSGQFFHSSGERLPW